MADAPSSDASSSAPEERSPLDDLEDDAFGDAGTFDEGDLPFDESDLFGGQNPFAGQDPFGGSGFGSDSPTVMVAKFWIRQNALLSVGLSFAAGALIGFFQK